MPSPLNLGPSQRLSQYQVINSLRIKSIFGVGNDGNSNQFIPFPGVNNSNPEIKDAIPKIGTNAQSIHNDDTNDVSIASIVEYTSGIPSMKLTFADFAYLKNVGVFPNNRLIVARRFQSGVHSDLSTVKDVPMATLVSWVPEDQEWLSADWGESWTDAEASFTSILNELGGDVKDLIGGSQLGNFAAGGMDMLPMPGFMEGIQYEILKKLGLQDDFGIGNSPLGNPNLIRQAKQRSLVSKNTAGSGLKCTITVTMNVEYEQKFINGLDPSLVYLDIIQNALTFGTSESVFQFNTKFQNSGSEFIKNLISGDLRAIAASIIQFVSALVEAISDIGAKIINALINPPRNDQFPNTNQIIDQIQKAFASTVGHVVSKYKVKLLGVLNALSGSPSAPWHVTIGNPKKPIFCSGDMLCETVKVELGKTLTFNDLPSSIKFSFSLTNARPLGAQEIFQRFNTGRGRSYARIKESFVEKSISATFSIKSGTVSTTIINQNGQSQSVVVNRTTLQNAQAVYTYNPLVNDPFYSINGPGSDWYSYNDPTVDPVIGDPVTNPSIGNTSEVQPSKSSVSTIPNTTVSIPPPTPPPTPTVGIQPAAESPVPGYVGGSWLGGQVLNSGKYSQQNVSINWSVSSAVQPNTYVGRWDTSDGGDKQTGESNYQVLVDYVKQEANSEFELALQSKGLTKI